MSANTYTDTWHELFGRPGGDEQTTREADLVEAQLARRPGAVLDVCCGLGRHAGELVRRGHSVVGVKRDPAVAAQARRTGADVLCLDVRELDAIGGSFDAVLCLWSSFGWFDEDGNAAVLAAMARRLAADGALVLDVYHPAFFARRHGLRVRRARGIEVRERNAVRGGRLRVELEYPARSVSERFSFQLFAPDELAAWGLGLGLELQLACCGFDPARPPSEDEPRYQLVLQRAPAPRP